MNYAIDMGTGAMIYTPIFIKIYSGIHSKVDSGRIHRHRQQGDQISLLLFFQNKESDLKIIHI
jgi:hypothetical protein